MSDIFETALDHAMLYEVGEFWNLEAPGVRDGTSKRGCGYVNDPDDPGGETKYGVSKNANPDLDIYNLDWDQAKTVYFEKYWLRGSCDQLSPRVAILHFDGCVNHGVSAASKFLQRAVGVTPDGVIGKYTLAAANASDPIDLCNSICDQRAQRYKNIVSNDSSQAKYLKGWLRRINEMREFSCGPATFL